MNMNKKTEKQEMVAYDFSNLDLQENSKGNCFGSCDVDCDGGTCDCNCDCDSNDCDCNTYCENCD